MAILRRDISTWLWRLLPGNPIFVRVLHGGGRRIRHLWIRLGYLSILFFVMFIALLSQMPSSGALDDLAKGSSQVFRFVSIAQLAMICFLAPVFMAAAITQEKDSQTYSILLSTPLSNAQIVLGSLMSRLFFVLVLLLAGVPLFCATTLYGGVTLRQIVLSTGIAATSAVLTGSLAIALSVTRVGTRRTIFSFYLTIALYLLVLGAMGYPRSFLRPMEAIRQIERTRALEAWVAEGNERPASPAILTAEPSDLHDVVTRSVGDEAVAIELYNRLRQADDVAAARQEAELTLFGCRNAPPNTNGERMSWLAPFHPLLALQVALNTVEAPPTAAEYGWPMDYLLTNPPYGYMSVTLLASLITVVASMVWVRRGSREGETSWLGRMTDWITRRTRYGDERRRKPRRVWHNPVAWREARTRASAAGRGMLRHFIVLVGLACAGVLFAIHVTGRDWIGISELRVWLTGLIVIEFTLILLMAANTSATAITREREANTMDLLLCTPLTSGYIIRGKIRGLVSFLIPLILVPVISLLAFAVYDLFFAFGRPVVWIEAPFQLGLLLIIYGAFACVLGLQMSLQLRRTVHAVLSTVAILMAISFVFGACGFGLVEIDESFGAVIGTFTPFTAVSLIVNPEWTLGIERSASLKLDYARLLMPIGTCVSAGFYALVVLGLYRSMIRNFDMTVRKQST